MNTDISTTPTVDVRALAQLSRVELSDAEIEKLESEIPHILGFVEIIQKADISQVVQDTSVRNVMRQDGEPHESGMYTKRLLEAAPAHDGNRIAVKQVISRK